MAIKYHNAHHHAIFWRRGPPAPTVSDMCEAVHGRDPLPSDSVDLGHNAPQQLAILVHADIRVFDLDLDR